MLNILTDVYQPVLEAASIEIFKADLVKFAMRQGFDLVNIDYRYPPPNSAWVSVNNYPKAWLEEQIPYQKVENPISSQISQMRGPITWDRDKYKIA